MKENLINYVPLKFYRYLRWKRVINQTYQYNKRNFSKEYADICRSAEIAVRKQRPKEEILSAYAKKDAYIMDYLENLCGDVIEKYRNIKMPEPCQEQPKKIWVFWWSGEETAPNIVKACIKSIRRHSNGHEVVMLDRYNYTKYVALPDEILKKHECGQIGHAHFSDLVRLVLLAEYGGVWIDATVFLSQPLPEEIFRSSFYTLKTYTPDAPYYSKSRWCGYFLAGNQYSLFYSFTRDLLIAHWLRSENIIDYLLMDYAFGIAYEHIEEVKRTIDALPDNNFKRGMLMNTINAPYSEELFNTLETQETFASKLSWRYGNPKTMTADGKLTNYGHLLNL